MGNFPFQAQDIGEEKQGKNVVSGSTSGLGMLKAGAAVAGMALLAWGTWQLLLQLSSGAADRTDEDGGKRTLVSERVNGNAGASGRGFQLEGFRRGLSRCPGKQCASPRSGIVPNPGSDEGVLKILSYNVWSEDLMLRERMKAIGDLIQEHSPDLICLQEVTPEIYEIFRNSRWWRVYSHSSVSPGRAYKKKYFCMQLSRFPANFFQKRIGLPSKERELCIAEVDVGVAGRQLAFATGHLVSPHPHARHPRQTYSVERMSQVKEALTLLKSYPDAVFGGDMNWDEEIDGPIPLPPGWVDAWEKLRPGEDGWTFDTMANPMLSCNRPLQKRLDRFLCCLEGFTVSSIEIIGTQAMPGLYYCKEKMVGNILVSEENILPLLPSDHFGLLLTIDTCTT